MAGLYVAIILWLTATCLILNALYIDKNSRLYDHKRLYRRKRASDKRITDAYPHERDPDNPERTHNGAHRIWRAYSGISIELHGLHWKWPR